jgi:hypothetical protein
MKLYENITIGNFLFALGYAIRDFQQGSKRAALGSINLLQQTPADQRPQGLCVRHFSSPRFAHTLLGSWATH